MLGSRFSKRCNAKSYNVSRNLQHRQTLKLQRESLAAQNTITSYGAGYIVVNQQRVDKSVIVLPERIIFDWGAKSFDALRADHFAALLAMEREVVLIGTGDRLRFPSAEILRPLVEAGIGVEVMDVQAACRTYNILLSENRKVAAALLLG